MQQEEQDTHASLHIAYAPPALELQWEKWCLPGQHGLP